MCEWGDTVDLTVCVEADLSHSGKARWATKPVDRCIAPLVEALNGAGILTRSACCGHGKGIGSVVLQDGRELLVLPQSVSSEVDRDASLRVYQSIHGEGGLVSSIHGNPPEAA